MINYFYLHENQRQVLIRRYKWNLSSFLHTGECLDAKMYSLGNNRKHCKIGGKFGPGP